MKLAAKIFALIAFFVTVAFAQREPTNLKVVTVTSNSVSLSWDDQSGGVKFKVVVSPGGFSEDNAGTSITFDGLTPATTYSWQVIAYKGNPSSGISKSGSSFTTLAAPPPPPPSRPSAPTGLSASASTNSASLSWSASSGATNYSVEVHDRSNFNSVIWSTSVSDASAEATGLVDNTTYYWRVKAGNSAGESGWSNGPQFKTTAAPARDPDPPTITATTATENSVTFTFAAVSSGTFDVQVATDDRMRNRVGSASTTSTTATVSGLQSGTTHYYEATVTVSGRTSRVTSGSFRTSTPQVQIPSAPGNLAATPTANGAIMSWGSVTGATSYVVEVYTDATFTTRLRSETTSSTTSTVTGLASATKYYWRVQAKNSAGSSGWTIANFTTPVSAPVAPTSLGSSPNSTGATLTWSAVATATSYIAEVYTDRNFNKLLWRDSSASTSITVSGLVANTQYYWRVQAKNLGGLSGWTISDFTTRVAAPSAPAGLTAVPAATGVVLSWGSVTGATSYAIEVHDKSNYRSLVKSATATAASATITGLAERTLYYWQVRAIGAGGEGAWAQAQFTTSSAPAAPAVTVVSSVTTASFTFSAVPNATSYDVKVMRRQGNGSVVGSGSTTDPARAVVVSGLDSKTQYDYEATATVSGQVSQPATGSFTTLDVSSLPSAPAVRLQEAATTVTFTFTAVTGATTYEARVLDKRGSTSIEVGRGSTTDPTKPVVITGLQPKTRYDYEATATVAGQISVPATGSFTTLDASTLPPAPAVTLKEAATSVTFTFTAVPNATSYDVRVLNKQGGTTVIGRASTIDPARPVVVTGLDPKTRYDYEATVTISGLTSQPATGTFTTLDASTLPPAPTVTLTTTANSVSFTFLPVANATAYEVRLFDKANNGTLVGTGSSAGTSLTVTIRNLRSKEKYFYEARATLGTQPSQPATGDFTTDDASTAISPPEVRVQITATTAVFTFTSVANATLYEVRLYDKQNTTHAVPLAGASTTDPTRPVTFQNLTSHERYYYEATVSAGVLVSMPTTGSFETDEAPQTDVVSAPADLAVSNVTSGSALISWSGGGQGVKFEIEVTPGGIRDANASSPYALASLVPGTPYTWSVRATKGNAVSGWVAGPVFTTLSSQPAPPAGAPEPPSALQVSAITATTAVLNWTSSTQGVKFDIQISPGGIADANAGAPYSVHSLEPSTRYTWFVRTVKGSVTSNWIQGPSFTTLAAPASAVESIDGEIPRKVVLTQNYPNPFNPSTNIEFSLPDASDVRLSIYNTLGNEIQRLVDGRYQAGRYLVTWDAAQFPSGVYFYRLQTQRSVETKRLILVK